jgi:hypothetical protein
MPRLSRTEIARNACDNIKQYSTMEEDFPVLSGDLADEDLPIAVPVDQREVERIHALAAAPVRRPIYST